LFKFKACEDSFLDDNIEMAKRFKLQNIKHELLVFTSGIPHGFLNMKNLCGETHDATNKVFSVLVKIFNSDKIL
jgi:hypothetical protein